VGDDGVFDGELVQTELVGKSEQLGFGGLVQSQPGHRSWLLGDLVAQPGQFDFAGLAAAVDVDRGVDDAGFDWRGGRFVVPSRVHDVFGRVGVRFAYRGNGTQAGQPRTHTTLRHGSSRMSSTVRDNRWVRLHRSKRDARHKERVGEKG